VEAKLHDNGDGSFRVSFKPTKSGVYRFDVDLLAKDGSSSKIKRSRFKVKINLDAAAKKGKDRVFYCSCGGVLVDQL